MRLVQSCSEPMRRTVIQVVSIALVLRVRAPKQMCVWRLRETICPGAGHEGTSTILPLILLQDIL